MRTKIIKARLILTEGEKVLLLEQTNESGGKYTLPGGTVENLEFAKKAVIRECKEEIGIKLQRKDLVVVHILHKQKIEEDRLTIYFKAINWESTVKCKEKKKFAAVSWFDRNNPPLRTSPTVRHVLGQVNMGVLYSELKIGKKSAFKQKKKELKINKKRNKRASYKQDAIEQPLKLENTPNSAPVIRSEQEEVREAIEKLRDRQ